ncbi:hypothetical protein [Actinomadura parmotrematis]|uniref:Phosphoribosyltransferase n=1 Tax=Actinomadura parmotrematis TaxID=2864039 RepID=A0ABS7FRR9_9ACTN|nr:hypothetical protein [Actinomadura parmotrematis]MBW8483011.1 hypothetical protein [Actinomadura parmotrematis]
MLESEVERRLCAALIATAGGYLRNPVRKSGVTCDVCTTPVEGGYRTCYRCKQHRLHSGVADAVAPVTYAVAGSQSGYMMRGYKAFPRKVEGPYRVVSLLTVLALEKHALCAEPMADAAVTHWASVPSLPVKPGEHPFHRIVSGTAPGREAVLEAASGVANARAVDGGHFTVRGPLPKGAHVLLLDDTWTSGGHAQSAALSLREAGADRISVLVAARWMKSDYQHNARFLGELPDFDPYICPWTGSVCP